MRLFIIPVVRRSYTFGNLVRDTSVLMNKTFFNDRDYFHEKLLNISTFNDIENSSDFKFSRTFSEESFVTQ